MVSGKHAGVIAAVAAVLTLPAYLFGQTRPVNEAAVFEVVSIKPNATGRGGVWGAIGSRFRATGVTTERLILYAYDLLVRARIVGEPSWIDEERFDVEAVAPTDLTADQMRAGIRSLLAERFGLVARMEQREVPVLALVLSRADGRLGPRLARTAVDCAALADVRAQAVREGRRPRPADQRPFCDETHLFGRVTTTGYTMSGGGFRIENLAPMLAGLVGRPGLDRTGLTGLFDFDMDFTLSFGDVTAAGADDSAVSLFVALEEQLGLRLESQRAPVDVLVIERIERPSAN